ncbi:ATP-binding protein [Bacillus thuringiensis]|uniref:HD domain-containing protein n=1 Tax=Bacillus thuringiensis TaxID=1428 RepID=UPI0039FC44F3
MNFIDILKAGKDNRNDNEKLAVLYEKLKPDIVNHLKNITSTLPDFDIHDGSHSEKILQNMLVLIDAQNKTNQFTGYEFFLLGLSAYMHDTGMSMPEWEVKLFKMIEGSHEFPLYNEDLDMNLNSDLKKPFSIIEAKDFILENTQTIYGDFAEIKDYIFIENNEEDFVSNLAKKMRNYQIFRSGYKSSLREIKDQNEYKRESLNLRYEFIRINHHIFSEKNCKNLTSKFQNSLGGTWGGKLAEDLAKICLGHGLDYSEINNYEVKSRYVNGNYANIKFLTVMLRLADVIHFSHERAPKSLLASKMIDNQISLLHWKVKQEGVDYWLTDFNPKGQREISFSGYFENPKLYYFLQDYLNWIDKEISNYYLFLGSMSSDINQKADSQLYDLQLAHSVNRSGIDYNSEKFQPVPNMKFTLDQVKIIELLMGIGLYKDQYLCLRELYQNALDACRCALANKDITEGRIEFGINKGRDGRKYLYCLDNGIGMTKDIIERYFLKIGNSFYKSNEFQEKQALWNTDFKPTSQFGIGILSCFMLGNEIEVCTKSSYSKQDEYISFMINGPHELFYYRFMEDADREVIGNSGTLIKIYLQDDIVLDNKYIKNIEETMFLAQLDKKKYGQDIYNNLYYKIYEMIASPNKSIPTYIKFDNNETEKLMENNHPVDLRKIDFEKVKDVIYNGRSYSKSYFEKLVTLQQIYEDINFINVEIESKYIKFEIPLALPSQNIQENISDLLNIYPVLSRDTGKMVDGIVVSDTKIIGNISNYRYSKDYSISNSNSIYIDFFGDKRPLLSVDRNSITTISDELVEDLQNLEARVAKEILDKIDEYFDTHKMANNQKDTILNHIFSKFDTFIMDFVDYSIRSEKNNNNFTLSNLSEYLDGPTKLFDFVNANTLKIRNNICFKRLSSKEKILYLSKLMSADYIEVTHESIIIKSTSFKLCNTFNIRDTLRHHLIPIMIYVDKWPHEFKDYDVVSSFWPLVQKDLFEITEEQGEENEINQRTKWIGSAGNGFSGLGAQEATQVHSTLGLFNSVTNRPFVTKTVNRILNFQTSRNPLLFLEIKDYERLVFEEQKDYFIYAYISPNELTIEEKAKLEEIKSEHPEYYEGVKYGWSILLMGNSGEFILNPSKVSKDTMLIQIKDKFFEENSEINYSFPNGNKIIKED